MKADKKTMLVYAVTDRAWLGGRRLEDDVEKAIRGGATFIQIRGFWSRRKLLRL